MTKARMTKADPYASERAAAASDADYEAGCAVRKLRDEGDAWWLIAQKLGLPGAGDSAKTGKSGAGKARRLYAAAFGSTPRSQTRTSKGGAPKEKNQHAAELNAQRKADRIAKLQSGEPVLNMALTDAELEDLLRGRKIEWTTMGLYGLDPVEREAWVHPDAYVKVTGEGADRVVDFREYHSRAGDAKGLPAQHRTIPLGQIHSVGKQQLPSLHREGAPSKRRKKQARLEAAAEGM